MKKDLKYSIPLEFYNKIDDRFTPKPYGVRNKSTRKWLLILSFLGNGLSIFLAYFFIIKLVTGSFDVFSSGLLTSFIVVGLLTLFEFLKRTIFDQFSHQFVLNKFKIFKQSAVSFIFMTVFMIALSFFMSLSGAKEFMNKEKYFTQNTENNITQYQDSITNFYYNDYIKPLKDQSSILLEQKNSIISQQSEYVKKGWSTKTFDKQIGDINYQLNKNDSLVSKYENERDNKISKYDENLSSKLSNFKDENKSNITIFLLFSAIIELVILGGIYYERLYEKMTKEEYEKTVMSTPKFKKWMKFKTLLDIIYNSGEQIGDQIKSNTSIQELVDIEEIQLTKNDIEQGFKIFSSLNIYKREGNKRILEIDYNEAQNILKNYFKIA